MNTGVRKSNLRGSENKKNVIVWDVRSISNGKCTTS